jgi:L-fuconolactonase
MTYPRREFLKSTTGIVASAFLPAPAAHATPAERPALIDCHTHFYDPARPQGVPWPSKNDQVLYRTVLPKQFLEQAAPLGVTKTVVVEASPWVEDNTWLLDLAAANPAVVGVVGHLSPGESGFADQLTRFAANALYRGVRVNHAPLRAGLERSEFVADLKRLAAAGRELDVNGGPELPADVARLAAQIPELTIIINHVANLDIDGAAPPQAWLAGMQAAAKHPRVFCKVSALVDHAKPRANGQGVPVDVDYYRPVLDALWTTFGDDRLIYGSNWPVSDRSAPYRTLFTIVDQYVRGRGREAADKFFHRNAVAAYRLPAQRLSS